MFVIPEQMKEVYGIQIGIQNLKFAIKVQEKAEEVSGVI